jgi:hypothetical protein
MEETVKFLTHTLAGQILAGGAISLILGQALLWLLPRPWFQRALGYGLNTAKGPGWALGLWVKVGPLRKLAAPLICLLVFVGFWFFGFMGALLSKSDPETRKIAEALERVLEKAGSTDRKLYIQSKGLTPEQSQAVVNMTEAVRAAPDALDPVAQKILEQASRIGEELAGRRVKG